MPFGDGTGPRGEGPMTGRGAGYCAGYRRPGYANSRPKRGLGRGYGRGYGSGRGPGFGRGFRGRYLRNYPDWIRGNRTQDISNEEELQNLREEERAIEKDLSTLKEDLDKVKNRISELEEK